MKIEVWGTLRSYEIEFSLGYTICYALMCEKGEIRIQFNLNENWSFQLILRKIR